MQNHQNEQQDETLCPDIRYILFVPWDKTGWIDRHTDLYLFLCTLARPSLRKPQQE